MKQAWLIIRTKEGYEQRAVDELAKAGIRAYAPTNRVTDGWNKSGRVPLVDGWIFVDSATAPTGRDIIGPIWFRDKEATVTYEEVQYMKLFMSHNTNIVTFKVPVRKGSGPELIETGLELPSLGLFLSHHAELFLIDKERARAF